MSARPAASATAPPEVQSKIDQAVTTASAALQRTECEAILAPPTGFQFTFTAGEVLATSTRSFEPAPPNKPDAAASVSDFGRSSTIRIHPRFADLGAGLELRFAGVGELAGVGPRPEISTAGGDLQRAVAILHEVGHLTGIEPAHEGRTDGAGNPVDPKVEEGIYNTRILNVCFSPGYLIGRFTCQQVFTPTSSYSSYSTINCDAGCRSGSGPVTMQWTSSLQSRITTDESGCNSTRISSCPPPLTIPGPFTGFTFPPVDIGLTITDASGRSSTDRMTVTCYDYSFG
jgi:hypothetical protein